MTIGKVLTEKWKEHKALAELFIGIAIAGVLIQTILLIFFDRPLYRALGLWLGVLCAVFSAWHMERSIVNTFGLDEKGAIAVMRKGALIRYAVAVALIGVGAYSGVFDPISGFVGVFTLKIAAYASPFTHNITKKVCGPDEGDIQTQGNKEAVRSGDYFGYTSEERRQLDENLSRKSEADRKCIEKMRADFSKYNSSACEDADT